MSETAPTPANQGLLVWNRLSTTKKVVMIILLAAFLTAFGLFVNYMAAPKMGVLFRGLNHDTASSVITRLDELNVPYRLAAGGSEILVPQNQIDELRINLSSDGSLYGSGLGFELFDQTQLGVSEAERRLNFQRALQVELQRTIAQIEGVDQARVHLVLPEPNVFIRDATDTTASVVLKTNPLQQLRQDQIAGVVYLVAGSVENLTPENVTVVDTKGHVLSNPQQPLQGTNDLNASASLVQMDIKRTFEKELEDRVQTMLERVLGPGTVVTMITADMDFDATETTEIVYGEPVLRSQGRTEYEYDGVGAGAGGNAGTDSNVPGYPVADGGEEHSRYIHQEEIENYEISETMTHTIRAPGKIVNLSASVIYDNSRGHLTPGQMENLEMLVAGALGLNPEREDQISIASIGFDTGYLEDSIEAMEQEAQLAQRRMYLHYGLIALACIVGAFLLLQIISRIKDYFTDQAEIQMISMKQAEEEKMKESPTVKPEEERQEKKVRDMTQQSPETAISLLKLWLMEDQK